MSDIYQPSGGYRKLHAFTFATIIPLLLDQDCWHGRLSPHRGRPYVGARTSRCVHSLKILGKELAYGLWTNIHNKAFDENGGGP